MSPLGYERKFWGPLIFVRFTPQSRHTEPQCPLLGLKRTICSRVIDVGLCAIPDIADLAGEAHQDRRQGRALRSLYHVPTRPGRHPEKPVRQHPAPD